jgi:hypothetical protein
MIVSEEWLAAIDAPEEKTKTKSQWILNVAQN